LNAAYFSYCEQKLAPMTKRFNSKFSQVLVCQVRQDSEANIVLSKTLNVLIETELLKPFRNVLHRGRRWQSFAKLHLQRSIPEAVQIAHRLVLKRSFAQMIGPAAPSARAGCTIRFFKTALLKVRPNAQLSQPLRRLGDHVDPPLQLALQFGDVRLVRDAVNAATN
jgi:hypothetical protein